MKKTLALLALLALAACAGNEKGPKSLGIGVYPGSPGENFSPTLEPGDGYRNIALLRAASHSSCADYNQTAQLVTDGLVADRPAPWTELFRGGEPLSKPESTFLTDQNHAGIICMGPEADFDLVFHGYRPVVDRILVASAGNQPQNTVLTVEGKGGTARGRCWAAPGPGRRKTPSSSTTGSSPCRYRGCLTLTGSILRAFRAIST